MCAVLLYFIASASLRVAAYTDVVPRPYDFFLMMMPAYYYNLIFLIISACLILFLLLQKCKVIKSYYPPFLLLGGLSVLVVYTILFLNCTVAHFWVPFAVVAVGIGGAVLFGRAAKAAGSRIFSDKLNLTILAAYLMNAASIVISIDVFGYVEKHFFTAFLFELIGTALIMFPLMFIIFFAAVWLLETLFKDEKVYEGDLPLLMVVKNSIKIMVIGFGLLPAIFISMRLFFGV
jgi:uncharacterized membrane protein